MRSGFVSAAFCILLSACAGFNAVDASKPADFGNGVTVDPQVPWSKVNSLNSSVSIWTIDGLGLNELRFITGVKPGDPLMSIAGVARRDVSEFRAAMLPDEVMELVGSTIGKLGYKQIRTAGLKPVQFGTVTGFRFDLTFTNGDGLQMKGVTLFAERRGRLDVFLFMAPQEYYFDHYAPIVDRVFASVRVPDPPPAKPAS